MDTASALIAADVVTARWRAPLSGSNAGFGLPLLRQRLCDHAPTSRLWVGTIALLDFLVVRSEGGCLCRNFRNQTLFSKRKVSIKAKTALITSIS
jgi:hypothetical protein